MAEFCEAFMQLTLNQSVLSQKYLVNSLIELINTFVSLKVTILSP